MDLEKKIWKKGALMIHILIPCKNFVNFKRVGQPICSIIHWCWCLNIFFQFFPSSSDWDFQRNFNTIIVLFWILLFLQHLMKIKNSANEQCHLIIIAALHWHWTVLWAAFFFIFINVYTVYITATVLRYRKKKMK